MTHPVAANQHLYTVLVQASVHIYKAAQKKCACFLGPHIYLLTFFFLAFKGVIQKVHLDNWHSARRKLEGKETAHAHVWWSRISWNSLRTKWAARSNRREVLARSLDGLLNIASQRTEERPSALKPPVMHLDASSSLSSQEIFLSSQLNYITAHAQVEWEREILSPLTGAHVQHEA